MLALGAYPDVSLKRAREKRDEARKLLADGIDPSERKKVEKQALAETFATVAEEWLSKQKTKPKTLKKTKWLLDDWLTKDLGSKPIRAISAPDLLAACRRLEAQGKNETAHRARALAGRVCDMP